MSQELIETLAAFYISYINVDIFLSDSPKCVLKCATTEGDTTSFGSVKDGTPCSDKPNSGVCVKGQCKVVIASKKGFTLGYVRQGRVTDQTVFIPNLKSEP